MPIITRIVTSRQRAVSIDAIMVDPESSCRPFALRGMLCCAPGDQRFFFRDPAAGWALVRKCRRQRVINTRRDLSPSARSSSTDSPSTVAPTIPFGDFARWALRSPNSRWRRSIAA
jgi:hypothetical protein